MLVHLQRGLQLRLGFTSGSGGTARADLRITTARADLRITTARAGLRITTARAGLLRARATGRDVLGLCLGLCLGLRLGLCLGLRLGLCLAPCLGLQLDMATLRSQAWARHGHGYGDGDSDGNIMVWCRGWCWCASDGHQASPALAMSPPPVCI